MNGFTIIEEQYKFVPIEEGIDINVIEEDYIMEIGNVILKVGGEANSVRVCNSEPSEPSEGDIYFNSVDKELYIAMG